MSLLNELKEAGLSINEAKVYLASLELGESTIVRISQKSKVKRATVYLAIDSLKEQGLISFTKRKNKTLFFAEDPRKLQEKIEEKKEKIAKIMPELLSFSNLIDKKPKIKYFEGREPVKEIFRDLLNYPNQELIGWFPDQSYWLGDDFFSDFIRVRIFRANANGAPAHGWDCGRLRIFHSQCLLWPAEYRLSSAAFGCCHHSDYHFRRNWVIFGKKPAKDLNLSPLPL